jgi:hypothetical protein
MRSAYLKYIEICTFGSDTKQVFNTRFSKHMMSANLRVYKPSSSTRGLIFFPPVNNPKTITP